MNVAVEELWPSGYSCSLKECSWGLPSAHAVMAGVTQHFGYAAVPELQTLTYGFSHPVSQDRELRGVNPFHPEFKPLQMHENSES